MEVDVCGILFKKVDDNTIGVYQDDTFYKNISYPSKTEQELRASANFYYVHCW